RFSRDWSSDVCSSDLPENRVHADTGACRQEKPLPSRGSCHPPLSVTPQGYGCPAPSRGFSEAAHTQTDGGWSAPINPTLFAPVHWGGSAQNQPGAVAAPMCP